MRVKFSSKYRGMIRFLFLLLATVLSDNMNGNSIRYSTNISWGTETIEEVTAANGKTYATISLEGTVQAEVPGIPDIPYKEYAFLLPDGAGNFKVSIESVEITDSIQFSSPLLPVQLPWSNNDLVNKPFLDVTNDLYDVSESLPECFIADEIYVNAQHHVVKIAVPTMEYVCNERKARLFGKIDIKLDYESGVTQPLSLVSSNDYDELEGIVVNLPKVKSKKQIVSQQKVLIANEWYYIITPKSLLSSMTKIGEWKKQKGYNVKIVTIEDILSTNGFKVNGTSILDEADAVRKWLISERKQVGRFYLLLAGNSKINSPVRKFKESTSSQSKELKDWISGAFIPTDGYYSDLTTNYVLQKEPDGHYSAYVGNLSFSPDLWVGRILADKTYEVDNYYNKLLIYELLPDKGPDWYSYLNTGMIVRQFQHKNYTSLFNKINGFTDSIVLTDTYGYTEFAKNKPTGETVINNMRKSGLISLMGHGTPTTFACSGGNKYPNTNTSAGKEMRYIKSISTYGPELRWLKQEEENNSFDLLKNAGKPGVVYTLACDIIPYDSLFNTNYGSGFLPYNMGEAYTVAGDFGGVIFVGNTRTGWDVSTKQMEYDFGQRISNRVSIGEAMRQSSLSISHRYAQYSRNLIGDPELKIWIGKPDKLSLSKTVTSNSIMLAGNHLINSKAVIFNGSSSKTYKLGESVSNTSFSKSEFGEDFLVSIYKDDFIPFTILYAQNSSLTSAKKYILSDTALSGSGSPCYLIKENGNLSLECIGNFESNRGFEVSKGGKLDIVCKSQVVLSADNVLSGGEIKVSGKSTEMKSGFTVNKGGTFSVSTF